MKLEVFGGGEDQKGERGGRTGDGEWDQIIDIHA